MAMIHIYDRVIPNNGVETLVVLGAVVFVSILAEMTLRTARRHILERAAERFEIAAYPAAVRSLLLCDSNAFGRLGQGDLYRGIMGIDRLRSAHVSETSMALLDLPFAFLFLAIILLISPEAGITILAVLAVSFMVLRIARRRVLVLQKRRRENEARRHSFLSETLRGLDIVKGMRIEHFMLRRYERLLGSSAEISAGTARSVQLAQGFTAALGTLSPLLMGSIGAVMVIRGDMTVGALAAIILLTSRIIQPILKVEAFLAGKENLRTDRDELEDILAVSEIRSGKQPLDAIESLQLSEVSTEATPETPIAFSELCTRFEPGDCIALKGPDKASLSAFLRLVSGDLPLCAGDIVVNGRSLFSYALQDRRERIRTLGPSHAMIEGTLIENMTMFRPRTFRDRAIGLAQEIGIEASVSQTPDGFEMRVGSGARAQLPKSLSDAALIVGGLVTDPDVILFNEANAALDREIDARLLAILKKGMKNRITIIVSSRPSFLKLANRTLDITPFISCRSDPAPSPGVAT